MTYPKIKFIIKAKQLPSNEIIYDSEYEYGKDDILSIIDISQILGKDNIESNGDCIQCNKKGIVNKIVNKDPMFEPIVHLIGRGAGSLDVGMWYCKCSNRGKFFTVDLCTNPIFNIVTRAVALNPYDADILQDLDTIIASDGVNKGGNIGASPIRYSSRSRKDKVIINVSFRANSDITIRSLMLLISTRYGCYDSSSCDDETPAPIGTCNADYYEPIWLPLWSIPVSISVTKDNLFVIDLILTITK